MKESLTAGLTAVITFVPKLLAFLVILIIGLLIGKAISKALAKVLQRVGFDRAVGAGWHQEGVGEESVRRLRHHRQDRLLRLDVVRVAAGVRSVRAEPDQ